MSKCRLETHMKQYCKQCIKINFKLGPYPPLLKLIHLTMQAWQTVPPLLPPPACAPGKPSEQHLPGGSVLQDLLCPKYDDALLVACLLLVDSPNLLLNQEEGKVNAHQEGQPDRHVRRSGCVRKAKHRRRKQREIILPSNILF